MFKEIQKDFLEYTRQTQRLQIEAYYEGVKLGVSLYAHWKDGTQYVGTCGKTLKDALKEIDRDRVERLESTFSVAPSA